MPIMICILPFVPYQPDHQCVPEIADIAASLHVFQRTPSSIDVRNNFATSEAKRQKWMSEGKGWAMRERERFDEAMGEGKARAARMAKRKAAQGKLTREEINEKKIQVRESSTLPLHPLPGLLIASSPLPVAPLPVLLFRLSVEFQVNGTDPPAS